MESFYIFGLVIIVNIHTDLNDVYRIKKSKIITFRKFIPKIIVNIDS